MHRNGPYQVHYGGENPGSDIFDSVIVAVPSPAVPALFDGLPKEMARHFHQVRYAPSIVVALALQERYRDTSMINNLGRKDFAVVGTVVFDHHKSPARMPDGRGLATAILCEEASTKMLDWSDEAITEEILRELDTLYPRLSDKLLFSRVYRWGIRRGAVASGSAEYTARGAAGCCNHDGSRLFRR